MKIFSDYSFQKDINYDTYEVCAEGGENTRLPERLVICTTTTRSAHFGNVKKLEYYYTCYNIKEVEVLGSRGGW